MRDWGRPTDRAAGERIAQRAPRRGAWLAACGCAVLALAVRAEPVLEDEVAVERFDRDLIAVRAAGGSSALRLESGETVHASEARGRVAAVATDRRWLAVTGTTPGWLELPRLLAETDVAPLLVRGRVALAATTHRVAVFDAEGRRWVTLPLSPAEQVLAVAAAQSVAAAVTSVRALGFAPGFAGFAEIDLRAQERVEQLTALAGVARLRTDQRLLVLRTDSAVWSVESTPRRP